MILNKRTLAVKIEDDSNSSLTDKQIDAMLERLADVFDKFKDDLASECRILTKDFGFKITSKMED